MKFISHILGIMVAVLPSVAVCQDNQKFMCPFSAGPTTEEFLEQPCATVMIDIYNKSTRILTNKCVGVIAAEIEITSKGQPLKTMQMLLEANETSSFPAFVPADATVKITSQVFMNPYDQYIDGELSSMLEYTEEPDPEDDTKNVKVTFINKSQTPIYISGRVDHPRLSGVPIHLCTFQKVIWLNAYSFVLPKKRRPTELFQVRSAVLTK